MKIEVAGFGVIEIDVKHSQKTCFVGQNQYRGHTQAVVRDTAGGNLIGEGVSYCGMNDNFSRHVGASVAVARALQKTSISRTQRAAIWKRFWNGKYGDKFNG